MSFSVKPVNEMHFESTLIPAGTLVKCIIEKCEGPKQSQSANGNYMLNWELKVCEGAYAGSKLFDNVGTAGSEGFMTMGRMKMGYALEINRNAHLNDNYEIENFAIFTGMKVVIKVGVETYVNKDGKPGYKNVTKAYGSPRADSKNHQIYADYVAGKQPYQTDELPPLPAARPNGAAPTRDYGHAGIDVPFDL